MVVFCCAVLVGFVCVRVSVGAVAFLCFAEKQRCVYIQNVPGCAFKALPCVPSKRPCHTSHGRFDGTHGSVMRSTHGNVSGKLSLSVWLSPFF